jgi:hypothetical protein
MPLERFNSCKLGRNHGREFLGMYHERDWDLHTINTPQPSRIEKLLADHGFSSARTLAAQLVHKVVLRSASEKSKHKDPFLSSYASIVGGLMHIANSTKPGMSLVASMLARYKACPADEHSAGAAQSALSRWLKGLLAGGWQKD